MAVKLLCITPNAAIDRTLVVSRFVVGAVQRPSEVLEVAGGKGMNVARAARALGAQPLCVAMLGGHTGRRFADLAAAEGLSGAWCWRADETRICTSIVDRVSGETTSLYERGAGLAAGEWQRFSATVSEAAAGADAVCLSGSLPPDVPPAAPADLLATRAVAERPVWVDTNGEPLRQALQVRPFGVKINRDEAGELLGIRPDEAATARAAAELLAFGVRVAAITMGAAGALLCCAAGAWRATPPPVATVSPVGSGDAFLAALALADAQGKPPAEALRLAVATGAANACYAGVAQWPADAVAALAAATTVEEVTGETG